MSYLNPTINANPNPIGIDAAVESIRAELEAIDWLTVSYGRAYMFSDEGQTIPKAYTRRGEYQNVLPNDNNAAQSFMVVTGPERFVNYSAFAPSTRTATVNLIVWGSLKKIDPTKDYIYTQELIKDVVEIVKQNKYVEAISQVIDDNTSVSYFGNSDVFEGFDLPKDSQYLMYPYMGFKVSFSVVYSEPC